MTCHNFLKISQKSFYEKFFGPSPCIQCDQMSLNYLLNIWSLTTTEILPKSKNLPKYV